MITASHLPAHRNGFKFFTKSGGLNKEDIAEVMLPFSEEWLLGETAWPQTPKPCTTATSVPQCSHFRPLHAPLHLTPVGLRDGYLLCIHTAVRTCLKGLVGS